MNLWPDRSGFHVRHELGCADVVHLGSGTGWLVSYTFPSFFLALSFGIIAKQHRAHLGGNQHGLLLAFVMGSA